MDHRMDHRSESVRFFFGHRTVKSLQTDYSRTSLKA